MKKFLRWLFGEEFDRTMKKIRSEERESAKKEYYRKNMADLESIAILSGKNELLCEQKTELLEKLEKANEEIIELKIYRLQYLELLQKTVE